MIVIYYDPTDNQIAGFFENCDCDPASRTSEGQIRVEVPPSLDAEARSLTVDAKVVITDGELTGFISHENPVVAAKTAQLRTEIASRKALNDNAIAKLIALGLTEEEVKTLATSIRTNR